MINPEYISKLVNFGPDIGDWKYDPKGKDMRNAQVLGSARIFNILKKEKIALLADEVGMGKTIQALSVCAALWNENPNAKILIIAPREEVARNWMSEYEGFIQSHYRFCDDKVKSQFGSDPVNEMVYCSNLLSLVFQMKQNWAKLFLIKTTSFSTLTMRSNIKGDLEDIGINPGSLNPDDNDAIIKLLRKNIDKIAQPYFDLLIIDEAHYFRYPDSGTLRSETAKILFGNETNPLAKKVLLMTATPNHSSKEDINNITSYFTSKFSDKKHKEILELICVRRLRKLSKEKGLNKYAYRNEKGLPSDFKADPIGELFFGLYHYQLVQEIEKARRSNEARPRGIDKLRTFLEATEFIPSSKAEPESKSINDIDDSEENIKPGKKGRNDEYYSGEDNNMLVKMATDYFKIFNRQPNHPKYQSLTRELKEKAEDEKALIFVRRIPSVFEISKRVIEDDNELLWKKLMKLEVFKDVKSIPSRINFSNYLNKINVEIDLIEEDINDIEDTEEAITKKNEEKKNKERKQKTEELPSHITYSEVLEFFVTNKKIEKGTEKNRYTVESTPASNFKERFEQTSKSPFALFFSPGPFYDERTYTELPIYKVKSGKKLVNDYFESALQFRLNENTDWREMNTHYISKRGAKTADTINEEMPTLFTIFWDYLKKENSFKDVYEQYKEYSPVEKEALSRFLMKGIVYGSSMVVDLFIIYWKILEENHNKNKELRGVELYLEFCKKVEILFTNSLLRIKIEDSIKHFRIIYKKNFKISKDEDLFKKEWREFTYLKIYPYNSKNKNSSVLDAFNTPFYPQFLVATSVLQEGVNLQFFCDKIYHYGAAWTPGDNEQRNGRIDRMFSLIERRLDNHDENTNQVRPTLDILYPYLKNTVDESNLSTFIVKKYAEEQLIDEGIGQEENEEIRSKDLTLINWEEFFRTPKNKTPEEPYGVNVNSFDKTSNAKVPSNIKNNVLPELIKASILSATEYKIDISPLSGVSNIDFVADPYIERKGSSVIRRQPVLFEFKYDSIASSIANESVYLLQMRSPLTSNRKWKELSSFLNSKSLRCPDNVKICFDNLPKAGNHWGLYTRIDLVLFAGNELNNELSKEEVIHHYTSLVEFTDLAEKMAFNDQDLSKKDLNLHDSAHVVKFNQVLPMSRGELKYPNWKYQNEFGYRISQVESFSVLNDKDIWLYNHKHRFLKFTSESKNLMAGVSLFTKDALEKEYTLLENYLNLKVKQIRYQL